MSIAMITIRILPFTADPSTPDPRQPVLPMPSVQPVRFEVQCADPKTLDRFTITQPSIGNGGYEPGSIAISGGRPITLMINVEDDQRPSLTEYVECGLAFNALHHHRHHHHGPARKVFPPFFVTDDGIVVTDSMKLGHYDFMLMFQNHHGASALIDPRITNTE